MKLRIHSVARVSLPLALAIVAMFGTPCAFAQTNGTWDGGGASGIWGGVNNWNPNGQIATGVGATATFANTYGTYADPFNIIVNTARTIGNISFTGTSNDITISRSDTNVLTLDVSSGSPTITVSNSARTLTMTTPIAGNDGMTKAGAGTLTLSAVNTYTGTTVISGGTLRLANTSALGGSTNVTMNTGAGTLSLGTDSAISLPNLTGSSLATTYTIVSDRATAGAALTHTFSGANFGNATFAFNAGSNVTSGTAGITFGGSPTLGGGGTGTATFAPGTANLTLPSLTATNASKTLVLDGTGNGFITGVISPGSVGITAVNKSNNSTWTLSGLNTFAGNVTISGGTLVAGSSGNGTNSNLGPVLSTRTINVNTGGTLRFDAPNVFHPTFSTPASSLPVLNIAGGTVTNGGSATNSALGDITLAGGTLTATTGSPIGTGQSGEGWGSWNLNGTVTSTGASTISSTAPGGIPITLSATATNGFVTTFDVQSGTLTASAVLGDITRIGNETTSGLAKTGVGTMVLTGVNTYTGNTAINQGVLTIGSVSALPGFDTAGRFSVAAGAILAVQNGVSDAEVGTILATNNFASGANLGFDTSAGNRTVATAMTDSTNGPLGIVKLGANALTLTGANTYTGGTSIQAGSLFLDSTSSLPNWNVSGGFSLASGTSLIIPNTISEAEVTTMLGTTNIAAGATLAFDTSLGNRNYVSAITDSNQGLLNISKIGANTLTLAGANTYTGSTAVTAGGLTVSGSIASTSNFTYGTAAATTNVGVLSGASMALATLQGANNTSAVAVYRQSGGTVTVGTPNSTAESAYAANSGYGYFEQSGGDLTVHSRFTAGSTGGGGGKGVTRIGGGGGAANMTVGDLLAISRGAGSIGELTVLPNANVNFQGTGTVNLLIHGNNTLGTGFLNITGGTLSSPNKQVSFGNGTSTNTSLGMINLGAGTLELGSNILLNVIGSGTNRGFLNFSGGTVKLLANTSGNLFLPTSNGGFTSLANTIFGPVSNSTTNLNGSGSASAVGAIIGTTQNFAGGLVIDTGSYSTAISGPLGAPSGSGVAQANIVVSNPGAGYVAPPTVVFSNPAAANASPAAGYALVADGELKGIVITSPGCYDALDTVTVTLTGGGAATPAVVDAIDGSTLTPNVSGGLAKTGTGTLTLSGANTYTGETAVNAGTLNLTGTLASNITVANNANLAGEGATTGSLTFAGTSDLSFDPTTVAAAFTAANVNATGASVTISPVVPATGTGIVVLSAAGGITGTAGGAGNNFIYTGRGNLYLSGDSKELLIDTAPLNLVWKGNDGTNPSFWDLNTTTNWDATGAQNFFTNDAVTFDNTASSFVVDINAADVSPGNMVFDHTGTYTVQGAFGITGGGTLTKTGTGTTVILNSNSYTGATTVSQGVLNIRNANALGSTTAGTTVLAGAALELQGGITTPEAITINGSGVSDTGALRNISGNNALSASLTLASASTIGIDADTLTLAGVSGAFPLTKVGAGTLNITGASAASSVTVAAGTLYMGFPSGPSTTTTFGAAVPVTLNGSSNLTIRRTNTGAVDAIGVISGTGSLTLLGNNANTTASGDFTLNNASTFSGGTTIIGSRAAPTVGTAFGTGTVTVGASAGIFVNAASQTFDNDFVIGGQGWNENSGLLGALRLNSTTLSGDITLTSNSRITSAGTSTLSGVISGDFGLDFFEDTVIGTISLAGANTYTGTTIVNSMGGGSTFPSLIVSNNNALGTTAEGTIVYGTGTGGNGSQLTLANGITVTDETLTLDSTSNGYRASLITAADATATWDGNVVTAGTGGTLAFHANGATSNLTVGSSEADTITGTNSLMVRGTGSGTVNSTIAIGTGNLFKTDGGTWTIASNNNSYTGATQAASGVLSFSTIANSGVNCAIGAGNSILLGQNSATAGVLRFTGASGGSSNRALTLANGATGGSGTIENSVAGQTLTLSGALTVNAPANACTLTLTGAGDGVFSGGIVGTPLMTLNKSGAGTWTVSGTTNHTGATNVTAGTLTLDAGSVVNAAASVGKFTVNGATAVANIAGTYQVASGNGDAYFEIRGGGTLNFNGTTTLGDGLTGAGIRIGEGSAGTMNMTGGTLTANLSTTSNLVVGRSAGGNGTLNLSGGTLTVTGAGGIQIANTAGNAGVVTISGSGQLVMNSTGTVTMGTGTSTINLNGGTFTLGSAMTASTGTSTINFNGGTLKSGLSSTTFLPAGLTSVNILAGGAIIDTNGFDDTIGKPLLTDLVSTGGGLTKQGTGTLTLTGANTYTGATLVSNGVLALVGGSQASPITLNPGTSLGFTLGSPTTSTSSFNLGAGTIKITGTPTLASYDLITSSSGINGTPVLDAPISGYELMVDGNSLKLVKLGYAAWAAIHAIDSAPNLDKDGDGVANAVEYVLGGTVATNDLGKLPTVDASGANLVFTFKRDRESIDGSTTVAIEVGNNLTGWPDVFSVGTTTGNSSAGVTVAENSPAGFDTITLTIAKDGDETKFGRLKVTVTE